MIIKTSIRRKDNKTKSASGAVDYILSNFDSSGKERSIKPKLIFGDPALIKLSDKHPNSPKTNKSTSGVISLRDDEKLDQKRSQDLLRKWMFLTIPEELSEEIDMLIVEHNDKNNTEFHFVIPHLTNEGRAFNPYPIIGNDRGKTAFKAAQAAQRLINNEFSFRQVVEGTGSKNGLSSGEIAAKNAGKTIELTSNKEDLNRKIRQSISNDKIKNRDELIAKLKSSGYRITRNGEDYISIKAPHQQKAMRLKGGIYSQNSANSYTLLHNTPATIEKYTERDKKRDEELCNIFRLMVFNQTKNGRTKFGLERQNDLLKEFNKIEKRTYKPIVSIIEKTKPSIPTAIKERAITPESVVDHVLSAVANKEITSRNALIGYLENNGCKVKAPEGDNTNYLDITLPGQQQGYRFAGSVFMEKGDWIYQQAQQNKMSVDKQFGYVEVYTIEEAQRRAKEHKNYVNSVFVTKDNSISSILHNSIKEHTNKAINGLGGGLGGQAIVSGVVQAEANVQSALSALSQAERQYGPSSPEAMQAKAALSQALQQLVYAKEQEEKSLEQDRLKNHIV